MNEVENIQSDAQPPSAAKLSLKEIRMALGEDYKPIMTVEEAAKVSRLAVKTLQKKVSEGKFKKSVKRVVELCGQQTLPGDGEGHRAGVDMDPPPPPLLRSLRRRPRPARRIQHQIAVVGGHEQATCNNLWFVRPTYTFSSP